MDARIHREPALRSPESVIKRRPLLLAATEQLATFAIGVTRSWTQARVFRPLYEISARYGVPHRPLQASARAFARAQCPIAATVGLICDPYATT